MTKRICSWCTNEDADLEFTTEVDGKGVTFHLCADCLYRVVKNSLGQPRRMIIKAKKKEKKEHKIVN